MTAARIRSALLPVILPVVLFAAWWILSAGSTQAYFPPLSRIVEAFFGYFTGESLQTDVLPSVLRLVTGYLLATVIGIAVGVVIGTNAVLRAMFEPVLEFIRAVPPPALVPLILLLAGIGDTSKVLIIAFGSVWPIMLNTVEGVRSVDEVLDDNSRVFGITGMQRTRSLVLRSASPQIVTGMRQSLSVAIVLMVVSEMFAAQSGIGYQVIAAQRTFAITQMWGGVLLLSLIGVLASLVFAVFERSSLTWYHGQRLSERNS